MTKRENLASENHRETAFLRHLILYDDTAEGHKLDERITQIQRNEHAVRRAVWVMALLSAVAVIGLGYAAVLLEDFPQNKSQLVIKMFSALGLGSLISLLAFVGLWIIYRAELKRRREECRRMVTKLLQSRLGKPHTMPVPWVVSGQEGASELTILPKRP
jgi:hypothetical protein